MELNRDNIKKIALIAGGTAVLYWALNHIPDLWGILASAIGLIFPFLLGMGIAFVLNVPMRGLEKLLFRPWKRLGGKVHLERLKRPVCLTLSFILVVGVGELVVIPQLGHIFLTMRDAAPEFIKEVQAWSDGILAKYPQIGEYIDKIEWEKIGQEVIQFLKAGAGSMLNSTVGVISSVFSGATTTFLGLIFSIYLLAQKEKLASQAKKLLYAHFKPKGVDEFLRICSLANRTFSSFITGQCVEAVILGCMFFIAMSVFRFPYALTISVIVGFTALIPVFGAFIGAILGALLILVNDPIQAVWFVVLFLALQQVEGNLIYPRVVGSSVGLPGIWVLVAVTIGGSAFGILGMLFMVPLGSVIYAIVREKTGKKLKENHVPPEKYQAGGQKGSCA